MKQKIGIHDHTTPDVRTRDDIAAVPRADRIAYWRHISEYGGGTSADSNYTPYLASFDGNTDMSLAVS